MLTDAQKLILKADILADPVLSVLPHNVDAASTIATAYDVIVVPAFIVKRTSVSVQEIMENDFLWTYVDNMTVGKARIWQWLTQYGTFNPSKPNVWAAIQEAYKGTAEALNAQAIVLGHCKRSATRGEKLFAVGTGTDASPAVLTFEGSMFYLDVRDAREM